MKLNQKKAVVFDLGGTPMDSMWVWKATNVKYLARFDLGCPEDLQKEIEGMSFSETATYFKKRFNLEDSPEQIKEAWVQILIGRYENGVPLKPEARTFSDYTSMNGIVAGIITSNGRVMAGAVLNSLDIRRYLRVMTMAYEVAAGKPAPGICLSMADRLHVKSPDCVVFENTPAGIQVGKNAGVNVLAVEDAFSQDMREEKRQLADYYIKDYYGLLGGAAR